MIYDFGEKTAKAKSLMIVRMKEISLFTTNHNLDATILELGQLGVVDIQETEGHP